MMFELLLDVMDGFRNLRDAHAEGRTLVAKQSFANPESFRVSTLTILFLLIERP